MRKITSLLMLFCMCVGMAWAGPTDLPEITTDESNPIYYTIYNTRSDSPGGLMYYAGDNVGLKDGCVYKCETLEAKYKFYFTGTHDALYVHNAATGKKLASVDSWTDAGIEWAVGVSPKGGGLAFGPKGGLGGNSCWNEQNGNRDGYTTWSANDDGSIFVCEKVEDCVFPELNKFYTIECPLFENVQRVKKALYLDESGELKWKTLDLTDKKFYWIPVKDGDRVILKSATTLIPGEVARTILEDYTTNTIAGASNVEIRVLGSNNFKIVAGSTTLHAGGHNSGNGESGDIVSWGGMINSASAWTFVEQVDPDAATEVIVRYKYTYKGEVKDKYTHETTTIVGAEYPALTTTLPFGVTGTKPTGTIAASDMDGGVVEKTIELSVNLPFTYADSYDNITNWYYVQMHSNPTYSKYIQAANGYIEWADAERTSGEADSYTWGFVGNPFDGFKLVNYGAGNSMGVNADAKSDPVKNPVLGDIASAVQWEIKASRVNADSEHFCFLFPGSNQYMNSQDGQVKFWNDNDQGSTMWVTERDLSIPAEVVELQKLVEQVEAVAGSYKKGDKVGQYSVESVDAVTAAVVVAKEELAKDEKDIDAVVEATTNLNQAIEDLSLNMPVAGKFYRMHNDDNYITSGVTNGGRIALTTTNNGAESVYYYDGEHLLAFSTGLYMGLNSNDWTFEAVGSNEISTIEFVAAANGAVAKYNIKSADRWLHRTDNYVNRCTNNTCGDAHNWTIEEVTWLPIPVNEEAGWTSLYSPVELELSFNRFKAYTVSEVNETYVELAEQTVIPANTGVVLEYQSGAENGCVYLQVKETATTSVTSELLGTYADTYITDAAYVLGLVEGEVGLYTAKMTDNQWLNNGFKAYLPKTVGSNVQALRFNFGGETTAIETVETENANAPIYDLSGRRVLSTVKGGIYIQNGKKFIVK